jgi:hypothetical protein
MISPIPAGTPDWDVPLNARLVEAQSRLAALEAFLNPLASGHETVPRSCVSNSGIGMTSGTLRLAFFTARRTGLCTGIRIPGGATAAGATPTLVRFGLYSVDGSGNLTLLSATASDTAVFAAALTNYTRNLAASQAVTAGSRYAIGVLVVTAATAPTLTGSSMLTGGETGQAPRLSGAVTGQTDLPASITAGTVADNPATVYGVAVGV